MQVADAFRDLGRYLPRPIKVLTVIGGVSINPQMMALRGGADIVVGTPGRLLDLADHNAIRLSEVSTLVLDEADRLLDEGFADELTRVLALLPDSRQTYCSLRLFRRPCGLLRSCCCVIRYTSTSLLLLRLRRTFSSVPSPWILSVAHNCCVTCFSIMAGSGRWSSLPRSTPLSTLH